MDIKNPKSNMKNAGFTPEERGKFAELLDFRLTDTFRYMHPDELNIPGGPIGLKHVKRMPDGGLIIL